jgi:hypothetical protein
MGSPDDEKGHPKTGETQHEVTLTRGFWIGRHEVTQARWTALMATNPGVISKSGPQAPVENIDWDQPIEFCHRLTGHERFLGILPDGFLCTAVVSSFSVTWRPREEGFPGRSRRMLWRWFSW